MRSQGFSLQRRGEPLKIKLVLLEISRYAHRNGSSRLDAMTARQQYSRAVGDGIDRTVGRHRKDGRRCGLQGYVRRRQRYAFLVGEIADNANRHDVASRQMGITARVVQIDERRTADRDGHCAGRRSTVTVVRQELEA